MKRYINYLGVVLLSVLLSSCFDDREILFTGSQIEFEDAVMRTPATGQLFPVITLTRTSGTPAYQVNLIASQLAQPEAVNFSTDAVPASLLNSTTIEAVQGVHYTLSGTSFQFPANASKASFTGLTILPGFPAQTGKTALLILKLDGSDNLKPSENYRKIGIRINLN
jgi:hypothetical protein